MDKLAKFLRGVPHLHKRLSHALREIKAGHLEGLDVKPLQGKKNIFRCRVGKVRILFIRENGQNIPFDMGFRSDIYKNL